ESDAVVGQIEVLEEVAADGAARNRSPRRGVSPAGADARREERLLDVGGDSQLLLLARLLADPLGVEAPCPPRIDHAEEGHDKDRRVEEQSHDVAPRSKRVRGDRVVEKGPGSHAPKHRGDAVADYL